ncbi:hypothetical protein B0T16DRAFT_403330 [Cercophora newfieldiana]|uniref:Uncharacterized protein n=1 Tax=Cercophora newfieldiana TaxID=92897 RepID=A0AA40CTV5_9PEZI|nr:hypothetical protein B0T16DRAFT_403330 [Cercophora newfieldiana]
MPHATVHPSTPTYQTQNPRLSIPSYTQPKNRQKRRVTPNDLIIIISRDCLTPRSKKKKEGTQDTRSVRPVLFSSVCS